MKDRDQRGANFQKVKDRDQRGANFQKRNSKAIPLTQRDRQHTTRWMMTGIIERPLTQLSKKNRQWKSVNNQTTVYLKIDSSQFCGPQNCELFNKSCIFALETKY